MAVNALNGVKGVANMSLVNTKGNKVIVLPVFKGAVFDLGITEEIVSAPSELGVDVPVFINKAAESPLLTGMFVRKTPEVLSVAMGREWNAAGSLAVTLIRNFRISGNTYPAATTGFEGFGVAANAAGSRCSVLKDGFSSPLTLAPDFTTFSNASANSFAVGLNMALKFGTDVQGLPAILEVPATLTDVRELGENLLDELRLTLILLMDDMRLMQLQFPSASVTLDGASINFTDSGIEVKFKPLYDGSTCLPYTLRYLGNASQRQCLRAA